MHIFCGRLSKGMFPLQDHLVSLLVSLGSFAVSTSLPLECVHILVYADRQSRCDSRTSLGSMPCMFNIVCEEQTTSDRTGSCCGPEHLLPLRLDDAYIPNMIRKASRRSLTGLHGASRARPRKGLA